MADETEETKAEEHLEQAETEEHAEQEEPRRARSRTAIAGRPMDPPASNRRTSPGQTPSQGGGPEDGDEADAEQGTELTDDTEPADASEENDEPAEPVTEPTTEPVSPQQRIIDTAQRAAQAGDGVRDRGRLGRP